MNNKLYSIKKLGFSIDWTLIEIGLYGKAFIKLKLLNQRLSNTVTLFWSTKQHMKKLL